MAFDVYSPCPAFTGNKVKFCCNDMAQDLIKLNKMLEGRQYKACVAEAERILAKKPDKACVRAIQVQALFSQKDQQPAFREKAKEFAATFPQNAMAHSAAAVAELFEGNIDKGIDHLQSALQFAPEGPLPWMLAMATEMCVRYLLQLNLPLAALGHAQLLASIIGNDPRAAKLTSQVLEECHLLMREDEPYASASAEHSWAEDYEIAVEHAELGMFKLAAIGLTQLGEAHPDGFVIWRSLGFCWGYLGDNEKAAKAFHRAALTADTASQAAEAEAMSQMLGPLEEEDRVQLVRESRTVQEVGRLLEKLASNPHLIAEPVDPASWQSQNLSPPEAHFLVLDRPRPRSPENMTLEEMPNLYGSLTLWGKRTDRPAKLEITFTDLPEPKQAIEALLKSLGDDVASEGERETQNQFPLEHHVLRPPMWVPPNLRPEQSHALSMALSLRQVCQVWVDTPLGYLGNQSPRQAAAELPTQVLAAILRLELSDLFDDPLALNPLRAELGLPTLELIRVPEDAPELSPGVSLAELQRLDVDTLPHAILEQATARSLNTHCDMIGVRMLKVLAKTIPAENIAPRLEVYRQLISMTRDSNLCLEYLKEARAITPTDNKPLHALWDVTEFRLRLSRSEGEQAEHILRTFESKYGRYPDAMKLMTSTLASLGMITPEGTVPVAPKRPAAAPPTTAPSSTGIWTPGAEAQPPAEKKTLWTPGME